MEQGIIGTASCAQMQWEKNGSESPGFAALLCLQKRMRERDGRGEGGEGDLASHNTIR